MPPPRWPARCRCISESLPWTGRDAGRTRSSQASQWPRPSIPSSVRRTGLRLEASAWDGLSGGKCLGQDCLETNALDSIAWRQMAWTGQDSAIRREVTRSCCEQRSSASDACPVRATMLFSLLSSCYSTGIFILNPTLAINHVAAVVHFDLLETLTDSLNVEFPFHGSILIYHSIFCQN